MLAIYRFARDALWRDVPPLFRIGILISTTLIPFLANYGLNFSTWETVLVTAIVLSLGIAILTLKSAAKLHAADRARRPTILSSPLIHWTGGTEVLFQGIFSETGTGLTLLVEYSHAGHSNDAPFVLHGTQIESRRFKIAHFERYIRNENLNVTLATVTTEGLQQVFRWGQSNSGHIQVGVTWGSYIGRIVAVQEDGTEEYYPFAVIGRSFSGRDPDQISERPPLLLSPRILTSLENW